MTAAIRRNTPMRALALAGNFVKTNFGVADALQAQHQTFNPAEQNERGALTISRF
jgi:hypothetical protein